MIDFFPIALCCAIGIVWMLTALAAGRLHNAFCARFPLIADQEIPHAFDPRMKTPEKLIFYFRKRAKDLLKDESALWRKRQWFVSLCVLSLLIPVGGFTVLAIFALAHLSK